MGWVQERDGSLTWMDERSGQATRNIPAERAALVKERWAEEERQRQGLIRSKPAMGTITEEDLRKTFAQPSETQLRAMAERDAVMAIEARMQENVRRAEEAAGKAIAGPTRLTDGTSRLG